MFDDHILSGGDTFESIQFNKTHIQFGDKKEIKGNVDRLGKNYSFVSMS